MLSPWSRSFVLLWLIPAGCYVDAIAVVALDGGATSSTEGTGQTDTTDTTDTTADTDDLPAPHDPQPAPQCSIDSESLDGPLPCDLELPSPSFAPVVDRVWAGTGSETSVLVTPLVANLDDDNGDGFVDVCDTPEIIVAAVELPADKTAPWPPGHVHLIDGRTGESRALATPIDAAINPALADVDGDGVAEIIASQAAGPNSPYQLSSRRLVALEADGELAWASDTWFDARGGGAIAIADLDNDGAPEILAPTHVAHAGGELSWAPQDPASAYSMPVAVDLDDDGDLEVLYGGTAYSHAGEHLFDSDWVPRDRGTVAVANFDIDDAPELYIQHGGEHGVFEADGTLLTVCPVGDAQIGGPAGHPVTIRDLDGDDQAELVFSHDGNFYVLSVIDGTCVLRWSKKANVDSGLSSGTVFDLLGDGLAQTIFTDRTHLRIYDAAGELLFQAGHDSRESIANPVVADVDGDGAAEIVIVASDPLGAAGSTPTVRVLENHDGRFAPTRRIWNQHTYHHSNIREDGRVPAFEAPAWLADNSFRANRSPVASELCIPPSFEDPSNNPSDP